MAAGVGGAGGGGDFFFFPMFASVHCRVRTHDSAARALPTKEPRKPWIAWRMWPLAWEKVVESKGGAYRPRGPSFGLQGGHCRVRTGATAGYAPRFDDCRVRTTLTLTLAGTAGTMRCLTAGYAPRCSDCRVRTQVW